MTIHINSALQIWIYRKWQESQNGILGKKIKTINEQIQILHKLKTPSAEWCIIEVRPSTYLHANKGVPVANIMHIPIKILQLPKSF